MKDKSKVIVLVSGILVIFLMVFGISFAIFRFGTESSNQQLVLGDIWMNYAESNGIFLEGALPGDPYSNYFEFTISGTNTYTKKDIYYDISLVRGEVPQEKEEANRIEDKYLMFRLTEVVGDTETEIFTDKTYSSLENERIHVETIGKGISNYSKTYRLYMVLSSELRFGNSEGAVLTMKEFEQAFASVKVNVTGDFNEKEIESDLTLAESIIAKGEADGLTNRENYDRSVYSGTNVKNYIYFNCNDNDGTYNYGDLNYDYQNNCEIWRILGVYGDSVKIVRDTFLTTDELPETYVVDGTTYTIESGTTGEVYWNNPDTLKSTNYNDWTTSGLQYFLNTERDTNGVIGYMGTLTDNTKNLISESTYSLGNVYVPDATPGAVYSNESGAVVCDPAVVSNSHDNACSIWSGNQKKWPGKVGLLYPSDYGYSTDVFNSGAWVMSFQNYYNYYIHETSWLFRGTEWLISPSSSSPDYVTYIDGSGPVYSSKTTTTAKVRPVLHIKTNTKILKGDGTVDLPYVVVAK